MIQKLLKSSFKGEGISLYKRIKVSDYDVFCESWDEFKEKVNELTNRPDEPLDKKEWVFRGTLKTHKLETTLERAAKHWKIKLNRLPFIESELIREICRKAFGLGIPMPPRVDSMWWVSLMQHYGSPTRLLDFTYSPYVASYFALEKLLGAPRDRAIVWAFQHEFTKTKDTSITDNQQKDIDRSRLHSLDFLFNPGKKKKPFIYQVNSTYLHDRLIVQQGIFLCPANISRSFMDNLKMMPNKNKEIIKRFILPPDVLKKAMPELHRMNITRYSLFPGIGGLAESIRYRLPYFNDLATHRMNH